MADKELDPFTKKIKKLTIWAVGLITITTALGFGLKLTVNAAEKVLFYYGLPGVIQNIQKTTSKTLEVVCEYHKSDKCSN